VPDAATMSVDPREAHPHTLLNELNLHIGGAEPPREPDERVPERTAHRKSHGPSSNQHLHRAAAFDCNGPVETRALDAGKLEEVQREGSCVGIH
jgi:hypothetical protein